MTSADAERHQEQILVLHAMTGTKEMRVQILDDKRVTSSLHGCTGTITKERAATYPVDSYGRRYSNRGEPKMFWVQFDEPQRGAGSVMNGVWLEESMFLQDSRDEAKIH